jgi:hypothetical protein
MTPTNMIQRVSDAQGRPVWLVSGHERERDLLADPRLSRSHPNPGTRPASPSRACSGSRSPIRKGSRLTFTGCASC